MSKQPPEILKYFIEDLLSWFPWFSYKSMFGSYSIYRFWKMFAILYDEEFYFKAWENNLDDYLEYNSKQFTYLKKWEIAKLNFYKIPEFLLENREELLLWIDKSLKVEAKTKSKPKVKTTELTQEVLNYIKTIPSWKVTTYKLLADKYKVHPRVISSIMKYNKEPWIYPCYKVVAYSWKISWYNTVRWTDEKIEKLKKDWIEIENGKIDKKYFFID